MPVAIAAFSSICLQITHTLYVVMNGRKKNAAGKKNIHTYLLDECVLKACIDWYFYLIQTSGMVTALLSEILNDIREMQKNCT